MPILQHGDTDIYWETHGEGDIAVCMGGWGTYAHGNLGGVPRALTERFQVLVLDYPGIGESTDDRSQAATTEVYAEKLAAVLDHLGSQPVHTVGMVGIGGCIAQQLAIHRPDLVRSLVLMGTWARADHMLRDQLALFADIHARADWETFQKFAAAFSFDPEFYELNRHRLLHPDGPWSELRDNLVTHQRLVDACLTHDVAGRLADVDVPALVIHATEDVITGTRLSEPLAAELPNVVERSIVGAHVIAGRERRSRLDSILNDFFNQLATADRQDVQHVS